MRAVWKRYTSLATYERQTSSGGGSIPSLDGLRGLAILLVVTGHYWIYSVQEGGVSNPIITWGVKKLDLVSISGWGVRLFFVLSAFLLYTVTAKAKDLQPLRFYKRRLLRILPGYYFVLLAYAALFFFFGRNARMYYVHWQDVLAHIFFLPQLLTIFGMKDFTAAVIQGTWSLAPEMYFYALLPLLAILTRNRIVFGVVTVAMLGLAHWYRVFTADPLLAQYPIIKLNLISFFDFFIIGMVVARLKLSSTLSRAVFELPRSTSWALATASLFLFVNQPVTFYNFPATFDKDQQVALACALLLIATLQKDSPLDSIFRRPWLRIVGIVSYSMFLTHILMVWYFYNGFMNLAGIMSPMHRFSLLMFVGIPITFIVSAFLYLHVELPFLEVRPVMADVWPRLKKAIFATALAIGLMVVLVAVANKISKGSMGQIEVLPFPDVYRPESFTTVSADNAAKITIEPYKGGTRFISKTNGAEWAMIHVVAPEALLKTIINRHVKVVATLTTDLSDCIQLAIFDGRVATDSGTGCIQAGGEKTVTVFAAPVSGPSAPGFWFGIRPKGRDFTIDLKDLIIYYY